MIVRQVTVEVNAEHLEYLSNKDTRSEVIMILPRPEGKILTLTKSFYPTGTYNLPSGGIHPNETPEQAFTREVAEETGLPVALQARIGRIDHQLCCGAKCLDFTSYAMLATQSDETPHPSDDDECISGYRDSGIDDLRLAADQMRNLTGRWLGFGRFRAAALEFVADYLANLPAATS